MPNQFEIKKLFQIKEECKKCGGTGTIEEFTKNELRFIQCSCLTEIEKKIKFIKANIPKRYWDWDFRSLTKEFRELNKNSYEFLDKYIANIKDRVRTGDGFWLSSAPGQAKSSIISYVLRKAIENGHVAYFTKASEILDEKFSAWASQDSKESLNFIVNDVDILSIEEMDKVYLKGETDAPNRLFYEFISEIYDSNKAILISSNLTRNEVLKKFPSFIYDRLAMLPELKLSGTSSGRLHVKI